MNGNVIDSNYNGVLVVRAKNALFNAGFDGLPRTLPDGTIFSTDKALKYCIREYLTQFKKEKVFVRRDRYTNEKGSLIYSNLKENFERKTNTTLKNLKDSEILKKLKEFIDVRLFGVVFSVDSNISLTGPTQISYGINKFPKSQIYMSDILSPYADKKPIQTTIGNEARVDEAYYVFDISVNKNNAIGEMGTGMTNKDLEILKETLMKSVDLVTSTTKFGVESVALLWFKNKEGLILNNLNDFVEIKEENNKKVVDFSTLMTQIKKQGINKENIELKSKKVKVEVSQ